MDLNIPFGSSPIKSIQRGRSGNDSSLTISEVNMDKTVVNLLSTIGYSNSTQLTREVYLQLTSSTTLRLIVPTPFVDVSWEVIEYV